MHNYIYRALEERVAYLEGNPECAEPDEIAFIKKEMSESTLEGKRLLAKKTLEDVMEKFINEFNEGEIRAIKALLMIVDDLEENILDYIIKHSDVVQYQVRL